MSTGTVRRARRDEVGAVAGALARAFHDDPVCVFMWPHASSRDRRFRRTVGRGMRSGWGRREVYTTDAYDGAAIWAPPGLWKLTAGQIVRAMPNLVTAPPRLAAVRGLLRMDHLHPDEPHWFLSVLGTVPERQGHGVGGELLAPVLARCDDEGIPVWTYSGNERNLAFYHRHGFEVLDKLEFARGGPTVFPIRREPRP